MNTAHCTDSLYLSYKANIEKESILKKKFEWPYKKNKPTIVSYFVDNLVQQNVFLWACKAFKNHKGGHICKESTTWTQKVQT